MCHILYAYNKNPLTRDEQYYKLTDGAYIGIERQLEIEWNSNTYLTRFGDYQKNKFHSTNALRRNELVREMYPNGFSSGKNVMTCEDALKAAEEYESQHQVTVGP